MTDLLGKQVVLKDTCYYYDSKSSYQLGRNIGTVKRVHDEPFAIVEVYWTDYKGDKCANTYAVSDVEIYHPLEMEEML